jgi:hypothetical protein
VIMRPVHTRAREIGTAASSLAPADIAVDIMFLLGVRICHYGCYESMTTPEANERTLVSFRDMRRSKF